MGIWLPEYFYGISRLKPLIIGAAVAVHALTWAVGPMNDTDGPMGIARVTGPPPIDGGTCPTSD